MQLGKKVEHHVSEGQSHEYGIALAAGQYARIVVEQRTVNVAAACFGPEGRKLFEVDNDKIGDPETIELVGAVSGPYRLQITAAERHAPAGRYEITLEETTTATERQKLRVAAARAFANGTAFSRPGTREAILKAIPQVEKAVADWRVAQDRTGQAKAVGKLALLYIELGNRQKALQYATEALSLARATGDPKAIAHALDSLGEVHNNFGEKKEAIAYYEQALSLLRTSGDRAGEGRTLSNLGVAFSGTGEKRGALAYYEQALHIFRELQDRAMLAEVAGNMGVAYDNLGEYQRALENHENELSLQRDLADRSSEAITLNNIGSAYSGLGAWQKALDAYTAALDINRSLDNRWNLAINFNNIAWVYANLGERQRALSFYQRSLDLVRAIQDQRRIAITLNNIAGIYAELGNFHKAIELHNEALPLRRAAGDRDGEANSLNYLGDAYRKLGEREKAREHFVSALAIHRKAGNRHMMARTLRNLGALCLENGEHDQALSFLGEALEVSREIHDRSGEAAALGDLARLDHDRGNDLEAHLKAETALAALESVRLGVASPSLRATLFASVRDLQELNIEALMRLHAQRPGNGYDATAFVAVERGRARSLLEMLGESRTAIHASVDAALIDRETELHRLISGKAERQMRLVSGKHTQAETAEAEKELDSLAVDLEQVKSRIRETSPRYAALTQPAPLDLNSLQKNVLDEETVLLEYALGAKRSFLWAVTPQSTSVFELPPRVEIESAAGHLYKIVTARNELPPKETAEQRALRLRQSDEAYFTAAAKVAATLLRPAAAQIQNKRLLIVGEGILQYVPFATLPEPGTTTPMCVNHEIVTAPSASVAAALREEAASRKPAEKAVAILADPVFSVDDARVWQQKKPSPERSGSLRSGGDLPAQEFVRLRFSRHEAEEIARLSPPGATLKALDFDASRDTALRSDLGQYRILHFATHSLLNNQHPELSGVVLSLVDRAGRPQNGFLRLYDIYNMRLGAELVVLSACQTALGQDIQGEGLIGLTRGFLYAGAPRVVATLWKTDDRTTAEAMKLFYEGMLAHGERPAAALRAAQVAMWRTKRWEAPYYWGAFTLQGEWR